MNRSPLRGRGLYAITHDLPQPIEQLRADAAAAIRGGAVVLQYRRKGTSRDRARRELAALRALCSETSTVLIVNDDIELALEAAADGVHLGRDDGDWEPLAATAGRGLLIGVSCYADLSRARRAEACGADYVAFGSFFESATKPEATHCPLEVLRVARRELALPIVAIGGITPENGAELVRAGADFLAVISGVFAQPSIEAAAARYANLFGDDHV